MTDTVENVWRRVLLHCPLATPFLAKNWVQTTYNRLCDRKPWSFLRAESQILVNDSHHGTVTTTYLSPTVQGVGMVFVAGDVGRQFRISYGPPYTILSINVGLNQATLELPWGSATFAIPTDGVVLDAYVTMPTDFGTFIAVLDPQNQWQLHTWVTQDELNLWDPGRSATGTPWALASRRLSTVTSTTGQIQYELWPYSRTQKRYPFYYYKRMAALQDTDFFQGPLRDRSDIILTGALREAAMWPGPSVAMKNPYFNPQIATMLATQHEEQASMLETRDEEAYITWLETVNFNRVPFAPIDANFLRSHDVSLVGSPGGFGW